MMISLLQIEVFMLILARISGIFIQAPIFSSRSFPGTAKTAIALWISIILWFVVPVRTELMPQTFMHFIFLVLLEVALGFSIGFICNTIFLAIQGAGEIVDLQMGLSVAQSFDPIFGATISIVGRMFFMIALTAFLILDGHHLLLSILHQSFKLISIPATLNLTSPNFILTIINTCQILLTIALQLSAPIILVIFISDFCFGIVSRVAPQVNVFMLGFQVKPSLGLLLLLFTLSLFVKHISFIMSNISEEILKALAAIKT